MYKKLLFILTFLAVLPKAVLAMTINSSLPKIQNPFDNLQVKIPGMERFTDAQIIRDGSDLSLGVNWIAEYIMGIYNYAISIIGVFAVLGIAIGGVMWIFSAGNPSRIAVGKDWIVSSILGLTIALGSYLILNTISSDLITFKPQKLRIIHDIDLDVSKITSSGGILTGGYNGKPTFSNNNSSFDSFLKQSAGEEGMDCTLAKAVMMAESNGQPRAMSTIVNKKTGQVRHAFGLMQLLPETAKAMGATGDLYDTVNNALYDPATNIKAGVKYLAYLKKNGCDGDNSNSVCNTNDITYIIAAYNGGPGSNKKSADCANQTVWQCTGNPGYKETRDYVKKVIANYNYLIQQGWGC